MRFVADAMHGKLAKWLRILGYDTVYIPDVDDDHLVRIAIREDRILLTRDRYLCERRIVRSRCVFVDWGTTVQQVKQVLNSLDLHPTTEGLFTRCAVCNGEIIQVSKEDVSDRIPPYVYKTQTEFGQCQGCSRVYWRGTHVEHVLESLDLGISRSPGEQMPGRADDNKME